MTKAKTKKAPKEKVVRKPQPNQLNPNALTCSTLSYWRNGVMATASMPLAQGKALVTEGKAFVISSGTIGALTVDGEYNS